MCAVDVSVVDDALAFLGCRAKVVTIDPHTLAEVDESILRLGEVTGRRASSRALVRSIQQRTARVADRVKARPRPRVAVLEWTDPPFAPGHWIPEMVWLAGGDPVQHSSSVSLRQPCARRSRRARHRCARGVRHRVRPDRDTRPLAARTSRITLDTNVLDALFQSPIILARRLATLDQFSDDRLVVGVGQGWTEQEFEAAGVSMRRRGAGFEEHILAMRAVWGPDPVSFEGRFYRIPEAAIGPNRYGRTARD